MIGDLTGAWALAWTQIWQVTAVIAVAAVATQLCCVRRPHMAYLLWLLVLAKCWIPPIWTSPSGVFCWLGAERPAVSSPASFDATSSDFNVEIAKAEDPSTRDAIDMPPQAMVETPQLPFMTTAGAGSTQPIWPRVAVAIWLSGVATLGAVASLRWLVWRRRLFRTGRNPEARLAARVAELAAQLGIRRKVRVIVSSDAAGPAVFGVWRPVLVLPGVLLDAIEGGQGLDAIVAHELIHVRRGDLLAGWLQLVTQIVWWFHPLVWWSGTRLSWERERCCDEEAVAGLRCEPAAYAQTLLDVLKVRRKLRPLVACPGIRAADVTRRRLEHIVRCGHRAHLHTPRRYWLAAAALFFLLVPGAAFRASGLTAIQGELDAAPETNSPAIRAERTVADDEREPSTPRNKDAEKDNAENAPAPDPKHAAKILPEHVERGIAFLRSQQRADGSWPDPVGYPGGITSLCTLALLRSGVAADDPAIDRALAFLRTLRPEMTYSTALATMVFCEAGRDEDRRLVRRNVAWFESVQKTDGPMQGAWGYPQAEGDNSNTGFAVMALYSADRAGIHVDEKVWRRMLDYWVKTQANRGSWGYKPGIPGTGSMTCEGVFCLAAAARVLNDADIDATAQPALNKATQWLATSFSPTVNPGTSGVQGWHFYYLFAASEAGRMAKLKKFGEHDWRQEGAKELLALQGPDGSWKGRGHAEDNPHVATSMALLFFRQGAE